MAGTAASAGRPAAEVLLQLPPQLLLRLPPWAQPTPLGLPA